jgi:hypothetical protein
MLPCETCLPMSQRWCAPSTPRSMRYSTPRRSQALRNSGTANEVWIPDAERLVHSIAPAATVECYVAGCGAQLSFSSEVAYQDAVRAIAGDHTWTGGKRWSEAARDGGRVTVALILYRPD